MVGRDSGYVDGAALVVHELPNLSDFVHAVDWLGGKELWQGAAAVGSHSFACKGMCHCSGLRPRSALERMSLKGWTCHWVPQRRT